MTTEDENTTNTINGNDDISKEIKNKNKEDNFNESSPKGTLSGRLGRIFFKNSKNINKISKTSAIPENSDTPNNSEFSNTSENSKVSKNSKNVKNPENEENVNESVSIPEKKEKSEKIGLFKIIMGSSSSDAGNSDPNSNSNNLDTTKKDISPNASSSVNLNVVDKKTSIDSKISNSSSPQDSESSKFFKTSKSSEPSDTSDSSNISKKTDSEKTNAKENKNKSVASKANSGLKSLGLIGKLPFIRGKNTAKPETFFNKIRKKIFGEKAKPDGVFSEISKNISKSFENFTKKISKNSENESKLFTFFTFFNKPISSKKYTSDETLGKRFINLFYVLLIAIGCACFAGESALFFNWFVMTIILYNVIKNSFIQMLGTFISSNKKMNRLNLFLYLALVFVLNIAVAWKTRGGEIHRGLLDEVAYQKSLSPYVLLVPVLLNLFTTFSIPISATFLTIPLFSHENSIISNLTRAFSGYFIAFCTSFGLWTVIYGKYKKFLKNGENYNLWRATQYLSVGMLWYAWLSTSMSSCLVFLPRVFDRRSLWLFLMVGVLLLAIILCDGINRKMEEIVEEKSDTKNLRSSVIFNLAQSLLLLLFKFNGHVHVATSWLFLGMLDGRELAITNIKATPMSGYSYRLCMQKITRDLTRAIVGIMVSLTFSNLIRV